MGVGFRKSFLGFNCDDVLKYIETTHKEYSEKESLLNEKLEELEQKYIEICEKYDAVNAENTSLSKQLDNYKEKEADIERLSEGIGKLYLVSKTSAKSIVSSASESSKLTFEQINKNIDAIDNAHNIFKDTKEKVTDAAQTFSEKIDNLADSLDAAKSCIQNNSDDAKKAVASFDNFLSTQSDN